MGSMHRSRPVQQRRRIENEMKKSPLYVPERRGGGEDLCEVQEVIVGSVGDGGVSGREREEERGRERKKMGAGQLPKEKNLKFF